MNKKLKYVCLCFAATLMTVLSIYSVFAVNISLKDNYTLIDGGDLNSSLPYFVSTSRDSYLAAGRGGKVVSGVVTADSQTHKVTLKLFDVIPVKEVNVNVLKSPLVVPSGECIGVKLYSGSLIAVGTVSFKTKNGDSVSPGVNAGIKPGDIIETVNGENVDSIADFAKKLDKINGKCIIGVLRRNERRELEAHPQICEDGHKRMGIMVRDSAAGIGTMTFYEKNTGKYAALGHGISDSDTDVLIPVRRGKLYGATILGINKGKKGAPGEIVGAINEKNTMGDCTLNTNIGLYGNTNAVKPDINGIEIASKSQVQKGKATVICTLDDTGAHEYELEIVNINRMRNNGTKSMIIKVTDPLLLKKTGGIIQGMSGSPIIQNGRLVGAVTHVFVNDPQRGYGIFAENMLAEAEKIE